MPGFKEGQRVRIPCVWELWPTPGEFLVTISGTVEGDISGFVREPHLERQPDSDIGFLNGVVLAIEVDSVMVQMPGSFFTTASGKTSVPSAWARDNLQVACA